MGKSTFIGLLRFLQHLSSSRKLVKYRYMSMAALPPRSWWLRSLSDRSCLLCVDDVDELGLERRTADQETVDIFLRA